MPKHIKNKKNKQRGGVDADALYKKVILDFLALFPKKSHSLQEIVTATELYHVTNIQALRSILKSLALSGRITIEGKNRYQLGKPKAEVIGKLSTTRAGFGWVKIEGMEEEVFIAQKSLGSAMNGDTVKIQLIDTFSREGKPMGQVVGVVSRSRTEFVGTMRREPNGIYFFIPDDPSISMDFVVRHTRLGGAKTGEKVQVKVISWDKRNPEAEVIEILGKAGEHETEMHAILLHYGFNPKFPDDVNAFADKISEVITPEEIKKRRDFRKISTFTIDPADAKDFDDALSFQQLPNGNYEVGIHIADVSHYLKEGTVLDTEAFKRATSVYLVDRTVPMLPEKLSNFLCSLRPKEEKLTYSAVFELDEKGNILGEWFGRTIIYSDHRFSYEDAQEVLEGKQEGPFKEELTILNTIAKNIRADRMEKGSVDFDSEEVRFELDENDKPIRLYVKERKDTNKLIEEFMLLANKQVATFVTKMFENPPLVFVYRIHEKPDPEKLNDLQQFIKHFGYDMNFATVKDPSQTLAMLMKNIEGKPEQNVIERVAIRSMAKAIYSTSNVGHFGLGFQFYSHFTSPIRRYPDVMVHRLLTQYLEKDYKANRERLEIECQHCSKMEKTAAEAERSSIKFKQVEFMTEQIGNIFEGVISGVKESGFYVEMSATLCEGMVPIWTISDDQYFYDDKNLTLTGRHSRRVFRMGDTVKVRVTKTNIQKKQIDLEVVS